jgi:hypothetical protein
MDLPSMVRLVVEEVAACDVRRLYVVFALIVHVSEGLRPKSGIDPREERLNPRVFPCPRDLQAGKIIVQNLV